MGADTVGRLLRVQQRLFLAGLGPVYGRRLLLMLAGALMKPTGAISGRARERFRRMYRPDEVDLWLKTGVNRFYLDYPSAVKMPEPSQLKAMAREGQAGAGLTAEELRHFYENGFTEPIRILPRSDCDRWARRLMAQTRKPGVYGFPSPRDLHLQDAELLELFRHSAVGDKIAQLLGEDSSIWRSEVFAKFHGSQAIMAHQATVYRPEDNAPAIWTDELSDFFQLTVWIALTDTRIDNGAMYIVPGSHLKEHQWTWGSGTRFYGFPPVEPVDKTVLENKRYLELEAGEAVIFTERAIHGSGPNNTIDPRIAINFRAVKSSCTVHQGKSRHYAAHHGHEYDLSAWRMIPMRNPAKVACGDAAESEPRVSATSEVMPIGPRSGTGRAFAGRDAHRSAS